jgi:hypothetical protein
MRLKKLSLSRIIENYLNSLTSDKTNNDIQISPFVKSFIRIKFQLIMIIRKVLIILEQKYK